MSQSKKKYSYLFFLNNKKDPKKDYYERMRNLRKEIMNHPYTRSYYVLQKHPEYYNV